MNRLALSGVLAGLLTFAGSVPGAGAKDEKKSGIEGRLGKKVTLDRADVPVSELLAQLAKDCDVTFVILEEEFRAAGEPRFRDRKVAKVAARDTPASKVLAEALKPLGATYRVKNDYIEIVPAKKT